GVQPIIGCQLDVKLDEFAPDGSDLDRNRRNGRSLSSLVLIAASQEGYANLVRIVSAAYLDTEDGDPPHANSELLQQHAEGLICLSGGPDGPVDLALSAGHPDRATARLNRLREIFGDRLYVELQRHEGHDKAV